LFFCEHPHFFLSYITWILPNPPSKDYLFHAPRAPVSPSLYYPSPSLAMGYYQFPPPFWLLHLFFFLSFFCVCFLSRKPPRAGCLSEAVMDFPCSKTANLFFPSFFFRVEYQCRNLILPSCPVLMTPSICVRQFVTPCAHGRPSLYIVFFFPRRDPHESPSHAIAFSLSPSAFFFPFQTATVPRRSPETISPFSPLLIIPPPSTWPSSRAPHPFSYVFFISLK